MKMPKLIMLLIFWSSLAAQDAKEDIFQGLSFRSIGPALTSGRIADIAIHPKNENQWYIAVGSGGVWKTINAGTTWTPIFDSQASYSIGCITLDPQNEHTIWVGTRENVGGRHVGFGDGIYVSHDGGMSWTNKGLKNSEHLSKIIVHPENSSTLWVASQGPLWSKGGERGVYKSTDGGITWKRTLGDDQWIGATDLLIDPTNPSILYAATWQRHRTVAAFMGSGPGTALHKSTDGGETWQKLSNGIPNVNLGKIGLAMNPFNPKMIYAAIELENLKGGIFVTTDAGASWSKYSDMVSGGTGPHYYQELYASPHVEGRLYLMNNTVQISENHGRTFTSMNERKKHIDSHAVAFKKSDPNYLLFGTDGGLYESFDHTKTWKYVSNLPVTQYYKIAVDDTEPFYNIYGGTQDNGSHGGPSRTTNKGGIYNHDWWITLFADGHQSATEPGNPNITYGEFQEGWLWRVDQITREAVFIQPQPGLGEPAERFNWDAPILVSPHKPSRLYFASQRVWKSEDRGDSWQAISGDLTLNQDRMQLPIMDGFPGADNGWDLKAMSTYNTITSLAESPLMAGLLYAATDDGLINISENGGQSWTRIGVGTIKGLPATAFVNDIRADLFDVSTVYVALDNHKYGDFKPYLIKSTDKGRTWSLITGDMPSRLIVWRLVQDHVNKNLLFAATEFGVYVSYDSGKKWTQLKAGLPTISVRDITIHRKADDLVLGTFGRGIYILDDLAPLRALDPTNLPKKAFLLDIENSLRYMEVPEVYGQGHAQYAASNPPFGAGFTYYLPEALKSLKEKRKESEKGNANIPFAGWDALDKEKNDQGHSIFLTVTDANGEVVKRVVGTNKKGFNIVHWPLDYEDRIMEPLKPMPQNQEEEFGSSSMMVPPGRYSARLSQVKDGVLTDLSEEKFFEVTSLHKAALPGKSVQQITAFATKFHSFMQAFSTTQDVLSRSTTTVAAMHRALAKAAKPNNALTSELHALTSQLQALSAELNGSPSRLEFGEKTWPNPSSGWFIGMVGLTSSTYGPTETHEASLDVAITQLKSITENLKRITQTQIPLILEQLKQAGAPLIEGQGLDN